MVFAGKILSETRAGKVDFGAAEHAGVHVLQRNLSATNKIARNTAAS